MHLGNDPEVGVPRVESGVVPPGILIGAGRALSGAKVRGERSGERRVLDDAALSRTTARSTKALIWLQPGICLCFSFARMNLYATETPFGDSH